MALELEHTDSFRISDSISANIEFIKKASDNEIKTYIRTNREYYLWYNLQKTLYYGIKIQEIEAVYKLYLLNRYYRKYITKLINESLENFLLKELVSTDEQFVKNTGEQEEFMLYSLIKNGANFLLYRNDYGILLKTDNWCNKKQKIEIAILQNYKIQR